MILAATWRLSLISSRSDPAELNFMEERGRVAVVGTMRAMARGRQ